MSGWPPVSGEGRPRSGAEQASQLMRQGAIPPDVREACPGNARLVRDGLPVAGAQAVPAFHKSP